MPKICFITTGDIKNIATAKRALGLADPLYQLGLDVSILMEDTEENRHRVDLECSKEIKVYYFKNDNVIQEIKIKNKLINEINPDFLYICAFVTRNIVGISHHSKKIVEHSELQSKIPDVKGITRLRILINEYYSILYSDALLNASKYLKDIYIRRCKQMLQFNKPNLYFPYAFSEKTTVLKKINRSIEPFTEYNSRKVFVFLGSIARNYGVFTIIDAINKVKESHPEVLMLFLGRGSHYNEACDYVIKKELSDYIKLPGFISEEDISTYFSLTDYFISPMNNTIQDWARCPSKLYMYLPYKKPIITCKIGEPYEMLKDEGFYYDTSSSQSLAQKIIDLINSKTTTINIIPSSHTWAARACEFDQWIKSTFNKNTK